MERPIINGVQGQAMDIVKKAKNETVEEYRLIKRRLLKSIEANREKGLALSNVILVTSALQGDGKTFTATNLA